MEKFKELHIYFNEITGEYALLMPDSWCSNNMAVYFQTQHLVNYERFRNDTVEPPYEYVGPATKLEKAIYGL